MSVRVMSRVWENSRQKGSALLLLVAIADSANDQGVGFAGVEFLKNKVRMSKRNTQVLINQLEASGEIYSSSGVGRGNKTFYAVLTGLGKDAIQKLLTDHFDCDTEKGANLASFMAQKMTESKTAKGANQRQEKVQTSVVKGVNQRKSTKGVSAHADKVNGQENHADPYYPDSSYPLLGISSLRSDIPADAPLAKAQGDPHTAPEQTIANFAAPEHTADVSKMVAPQSSIEDPNPPVPNTPLIPSSVNAGTTFNRAEHGAVLSKASARTTDDRPAKSDVIPIASNTPVADQNFNPTVATTNTVTRTLLDDAPPGHEWWFAGDNAGVAHLLKGGTGRPLCKPKHWRYPNKCAAFMAFVACSDCQRAYAESIKPKAPRPRNVVFDLIAKYGYGTDKVTSPRIGARIGRDAQDVRGCTSEEHLPTLEQDLEFAYIWWINVKKLSARDAGAICGMLNDWRVAGSPKPVRKVAYDKNCPKCLGSGVIMPVGSNEAYPCDCGKEQQ